ncbi:tetratricopeptide repeat protein [Noviherbaspirillum pedocola]|uniref:Glycosyltransferase family protein n=1 Tax=Noviherbaspirillum pedocola TaxID=2801341 RepID=A0A934W2B0_9BURK|nr:tetratricopeptide repeat-containing glycosyltransferase family protein [Noviherbaspirillum pedocola]MBK4736121.1 glycosyltransferase family protein [Noviherbaspirillum pedocola]
MRQDRTFAWPASLAWKRKFSFSFRLCAFKATITRLFPHGAGVATWKTRKCTMPVSHSTSWFLRSVMPKRNKPVRAKDPGAAPDVKQRFEAAFAFHQRGALDDAMRLYEEVLALSPNHHKALHGVGAIAFQCGDYASAAGFFGRSAAYHPHNAHTLYHLGCAYQALGQMEDALCCYDRAIILTPGLYEAHANRGVVQSELGRPQDALASFDRALALRPQSANDLANRATVLRELGQMEEALASSEEALQMEPLHAKAHYIRATILASLERLDAALDSYDAAIACQPDYAAAHMDRGVVLRDSCRVDEAVLSFERAIALKPDAPAAYFNESLAVLLRGDLRPGWELYEARWLCQPMMRKPRFSQPEWTGMEWGHGKTLLLYAEQGLGDTIQFCRYALLAKALFARVVLEVQPALVGVLRGLPGVHVVAAGDPRPAFDYHAALMSMPRLFKTDLQSIPFRAPYIAADASKVRAWHDRLGPKTRPRVGLVWNGGLRADRPDLAAVNRRRNLTLEQIAQLRCDGIDFYSLQKGEPAESELRLRRDEVWPESNLHSHADMLHDFSDTAALISNLDLVISVDTSTAHLAAAMGKPVWILNRFDTCWRWLLDRRDSPWYSSAVVYRQPRAGDWESVIAQMREDLLALAK